MSNESESISPRELESMLGTTSRIVRDVVVREVIGNTKDYEDVLKPDFEHDPAVIALEKVVNSIQKGGRVPADAGIEKLIHGQEERADLMDQLLLTHEYSRLIKFIKARGVIESVLLAASERGKLTPTEALAFLQLMTSEIKQMSGRIRSGASSIKDIEAMLGKIDWQMQQDEVGLMKKFEKTSPQNREIIRRFSHKISKIEKQKRSDQ